VGVRPGQRVWKETCEIWIQEFEAIVEEALQPRVIRAGFAKSGIFPLNRELITSLLPKSYPAWLGERKITKSLFDINNKVVSSPNIQKDWKEDEEKKNSQKIKVKKDTEMKENQVEIQKVINEYKKRSWEINAHSCYVNENIQVNDRDEEGDPEEDDEGNIIYFYISIELQYYLYYLCRKNSYIGEAISTGSYT
jgi:hypothetical protein